MADCNYTTPVGGSYVNVIFADQRNRDNPLIQEYLQKPNYVVIFLFDYLIYGKPFYVPQFTPEAVDVIKIIEASGGIAVLAHPGSNLKREENYVIGELQNKGLAGVEVYTSHHSDEQEEYYLAYCRDLGLIYTCGSDFHGRFKPKVQLAGIKNNTDQVAEILKQTWLKKSGKTNGLEAAN
jgi:hypothetical protein